jgi:hypothetical protein
VDAIEVPSSFSIAQHKGMPSGVIFRWNPYESIKPLLTGYGKELLG